MNLSYVKWGDPAPFDTYLLVHFAESGGEQLAFEVSDVLDMDTLLQKALEQIYGRWYTVQLETFRQNGGSNYACIITDGRDTNSVIVWDSCDFHYTLDE